jgi:hypothetical protein
MNNQQAPRKSTASVPVREATRGAPQITNKEFVEWIKEVEGDSSTGCSDPNRRRMPRKRKQAKPDHF